MSIFSVDEEEETTLTAAEYTPVPADDEDVPIIPKSAVALSLVDKWELVKPLMLKFMFPLCE